MPIQFLFDYLSPYSYIAWTQIQDLAKRYHRSIEPRPVLLAGLLNATGQKGPAEVEAERLYIFKDICRTAQFLGIPFSPPPFHPFNPLLALRISSLPLEPKIQLKIVDNLFATVWGEGKEISDRNTIYTLLISMGLDGNALIEQAETVESKTRLKTNTEKALEVGIFGVPSILVEGELFWGYESFQNLERFLQGHREIDIKLFERWKNIKPSATRK